MKSSINYLNIKNSLSYSRLATYEKLTRDTEAAVQLYQWNLQISSALFECLAVCEVVIRNATAKAIQDVYGHDWAWNMTFLLSLQANAREALIKANKNFTTIDKIIPELPFYFWQSIFTARFDQKIWHSTLITALPSADHSDLKQLRAMIFGDLEKIRKLRNRIAHHEPIFDKNLSKYYEQIIKIIEYCCKDTAAWVRSWQQVTLLLDKRPIN